MAAIAKVSQFERGNQISGSKSMIKSWTIFQTASAIVVCCIGLVATAVTTLAANAGSSGPARPENSASDSAAVQPHVAALIERLGDPQYAVRQEAQEQLAKMGSDAFDPLVAAQDNDDLEISARARYLVHLIRIDWIHETDSPQVKDALSDYDTKGVRDRRAVIQHLAQMPRSESLAPMCRLIRYEKSQILSKETALCIMLPTDPTDLPWPQQARQITEALAGSQRAPARWLRNYVRMHDDPKGAVAGWDKLVAEELTVSDATDQPDEVRLQNLLMRYEAQTLMARSQRERAIAVMRSMIPRVNDNVDSLVSFVDWLVEQKAWEVVDETARQFDRTFAADRTLLYAEAQSFKTRGDELSAERLAEQAFKIASSEPEDVAARFNTARRLFMRGMVAWSEREYRRIIDSEAPDSKEVVNGRNQLAEIFHDQSRDAEAAKLLQPLVDMMDKNSDFAQHLATGAASGDYDSRPGMLRAQFYYYQSCDARAKNDRHREAAQLDRAIEQGDSNDPNPDVIIALYRLPNQSAQRHKQTLDLIHRTVQTYENSLASQSDPPNTRILYNEYAWLVANTEGDLNRALDYARRAVDLAPSDGEVLDTLGHCYAAKKDYDNAVKCQAHAVELDPSSEQIRHALDEFRKLRDQAKAKK